MDLKTAIQNDMKEALKAGYPTKVGALRMLIAEIKKREIDKRAPLDEAEIQKSISSLIKQRNESIEAFTKGGRQDLAEKEKQEITYLQAYQPEAMSSGELEDLVTWAITETSATSSRDIGKVMKAALAKAAGRADGKTINEIARARLA